MQLELQMKIKSYVINAEQKFVFFVEMAGMKGKYLNFISL